MSYVCFSLFWPKKVNFKAKIDSFLTITLKKPVLMRTLQCTETLILYLFVLPMKVWTNNPQKKFLLLPPKQQKYQILVYLGYEFELSIIN